MARDNNWREVLNSFRFTCTILWTLIVYQPFYLRGKIGLDYHYSHFINKGKCSKRLSDKSKIKSSVFKSSLSPFLVTAQLERFSPLAHTLSSLSIFKLIQVLTLFLWSSSRPLLVNNFYRNRFSELLAKVTGISFV